LPSFVASYLALCREDSAQREHSLRAVFNGLRYIVKTGNQWRFMPHDLPPWPAVYQQTQRWIRAGVFELLVEDLRSLLREFAGRSARPTAMMLDSQHDPVHAGVGSAGRLRWRETPQGLQGACGGGHARTPAGAACDRSR
jgi:transposase